MLDDSNIDQLSMASENISNSCSLPVRNEETGDAKVDQKGKRKAWVILLRSALMFLEFFILIVLPC